MKDIQPKVNTDKKPCKIRFKKLSKKEREALEIGKDEVIPSTYVTMVQAQQGGYKDVKISHEQMKATVSMLSMVPHKKDSEPAEKSNADKYRFGDPNSSTFEVNYSRQYELEDHKYVMEIIATIGKNKEQENNENNNNENIEQ